MNANPNATNEQINSYVEGLTDGQAHYDVCNINVGIDNTTSITLGRDVSNGIVIILGTTDNPNGVASITDICPSFNLAYYNSLSPEDQTKYVEALVLDALGQFDQIMSIGPHGDDVIPELPPAGKVWHKSTNGQYYYNHIIPTGEVKIYNKDFVGKDVNDKQINDTDTHEYDVTEVIPTSENLFFDVTEVDDILYSIKVSTHTAWGGCTDIPVVFTAGYKYHVWIPDKKSGDEVIEKGHFEERHGTKTGPQIGEAVSYTGHKATCLSVTPNIYQAEYALVKDAPTESDVKIEFYQENLNYAGFSSSFSNERDPAVPLIYSYFVGEYEEEREATAAVSHDQNGWYASAVAQIKALVDAVPGGSSAHNNGTGTNKTATEFDFRGSHITSGSDNHIEPEVRSAQPKGTVVEMIPSYKKNGLYDPVAELHYTGYQPVNISVNDVNVHTPVVDRAYIETESFKDQRVNPSSNIAIQLDKRFSVIFPNDGTHITKRGYGTRNYLSNQAIPKEDSNWGKYKDVKLSFDAYLLYKDSSGKEKTFFVPANTWLGDMADVPVKLTSMKYEFLLPVWVDEGEQTVWTEVVAENVTTNEQLQAMQKDANTDITKYIATKDITVEIVGKIYDLQVSNSNDRDWETKVQSQIFNTDNVLANEFPFGQTQKGRNNVYSSITNVKSQNKNSSYAFAPKLGSSFIFNFKTKGRKSNNIDISVANNGFYFVSKEGGAAKPVNLYYKKNSTYKRLGTGAEDLNIKVAITDSYLKVDSQEITDSNKIYPIEGYTRYNYSNKVNIGTLRSLNLPHSMRMCYNNFIEYMTDNGGEGLYKQTKDNIIENAKTSSEGGSDRVVGSVGRWYAGYALPTTTVAVDPSLTDARAIEAIRSNDTSKLFKNGYIIVVFNISTNNNSSKYLKYYGPEARFTSGSDIGKEDKTKEDPVINWTTPNGMMTITLPNGKTATVPNGAVTMYESDTSIQIENTKDIVY